MTELIVTWSTEICTAFAIVVCIASNAKVILNTWVLRFSYIFSPFWWYIQYSLNWKPLDQCICRKKRFEEKSKQLLWNRNKWEIVKTEIGVMQGTKLKWRTRSSYKRFVVRFLSFFSCLSIKIVYHSLTYLIKICHSQCESLSRNGITMTAIEKLFFELFFAHTLQ